MKRIQKTLLILLMALCASCARNEKSGDNMKQSAESILLSDEFTSDSNQLQSSGLSNPNNVGVNKSKFYQEKKYDSESLNIIHTINAADYGVNGTDQRDDTAAMIDVLNAAMQYNGQELTKIVLPAGDLDFIEKVNELDRNVSILFNNLKNIVFSGNNTNLYFHGEVQAIKVLNCENIYFENINIDWGIAPFSMGVIQENDGKTFKVKVNEGYSVDESTVIAAFLEYNPTSFTPRSRGNDIYGHVLSTHYLGDNVLEITFDSQYNIAPKGALVVLRHYLYEHDAFYLEKSKSIHFENVNFYSCPGMGVRAHSCDNIYFNRTNCMIKPNTDRLMTATADFLHFIDCSGDLEVSNCLIENCGDDALNAHGAYLQIKNIENDNTIVVINPRGYNFKPNVGDKLEINSRQDLSLIQTVTVKSAETLPSGGFRIECNENINENVQINYVVGNASRFTHLRFTNNIVRNKRCRGVLVQSRDSIIENNTFANLSDGGILITADANNWYESITSKDCVIRNNKFLKNCYAIGNTYGEITISAYGENYNHSATGTVSNISIENNFFGNCANGAVYAFSVDGLSIKNNCIYNMGLLPKSKIANMGITIDSCKDINISNNKVYGNSSNEFKPLAIGGGINVDLAVIENNDGIDKSSLTNESSVKSFSISKDESVGLMDGNDLSKWLNMSSLELYGFSDVELSEIELDESSFKVNELKLGYSNDGLYLGFDIFDDEIIYNRTAFWEGDGVEIFISSNTDSLDPLSVVKISNDNTIELFMSGDRETGNKVVEVRTSSNIMENQDKIVMKFYEKEENGYVGKAYIPFELIPDVKELLDSGKEFSFCINFIDIDSYGIRRQYATCPHIVEYNKYTPAKMSHISKKEGE